MKAFEKSARNLATRKSGDSTPIFRIALLTQNWVPCQRFVPTCPYAPGQIPSRMETMPAIAAAKASERASGMPKA